MKALSFAIAAMLAVAAPVSAQQITGAGATFPAPVYAKWAEAAKAAVGVELNYQAIGSGGGQNQMRRCPRRSWRSRSCCSFHR